MSTLKVHFLPQLVAPEDLAGGTVVVIDVLRATTTVAYALAAGARAIVPCLEIDEARSVAASLASSDRVLGGERGGEKIEAFDLGNSPLEYTPETVGGRTVVFTTTNGTRALRHCQLAKRVLLGAFVNLSAVVKAVADDGDVHLLCAGTRGAITGEDVLLAGAIAARLSDDGSGASSSVVESSSVKLRPAFSLNDQARIAVACWRNLAGKRAALPAHDELIAELRAALGGRDLIELGFDADIEAAAAIDRFDVAPQWDVASGRVRVN